MDNGPLDGFMVAVTADRRAEEQIELLRRRGARILHGPVVRTLPLAGEEGLRSVTDALIEQPPDVVIANTGIGMRGWLSAAESWGLGAALASVLRGAEIVARGPKAAGAIVTIGGDVAWRGASGRLADVVTHLTDRGVAGMRIALQRDGSDCPDAVSTLRAAGADLVEIPVYRWTRPEDEGPARRLLEATCSGEVDAVTFTSRPAVANLVELAREQGLRDDLVAALSGEVVAVCVGPVCLDGALAQGFLSAVAPGRPVLGAMVTLAAAELGARRLVVQLRAGELVLQGSTAVVDGARVELTARERAVLAALAQRAGTVVSKTTLLREIWGADGADPHALEMTVSRLRSRLGTAGTSLETVLRRGYLLATT